MENHEVTELLIKWDGGDKDVLDRLLPIVYAELHRIGGALFAGERVEHNPPRRYY